eukprot:5436376-Prymnesium_polylepis.1
MCAFWVRMLLPARFRRCDNRESARRRRDRSRCGHLCCAACDVFRSRVAQNSGPLSIWEVILGVSDSYNRCSWCKSLLPPASEQIAHDLSRL